MTDASGINIEISEVHQIDTSDLKYCVSGGMATEEAVAKRWEKHTGTILLEGYGLTECSPTVLFNPINNKEFTGMTGLPLPQTDPQGSPELPKAPQTSPENSPEHSSEFPIVPQRGPHSHGAHRF